jgi:inward rectifier potassium channel
MAALSEQIKVTRIGIKHRFLQELYFFVLKKSWFQFILTFISIYVVINCVFAALYLVDPEGIGNIDKGSFFDAFAFSNQTFSTVGYGFYLPKTTYAHVIVILESMIGILYMAIITGLTFAKFARPTTQVIFTDKALIANFDGTPTLMFRIGNGRDTSIVDAKISVVTLRPQVTKENFSIQRFVDLKLERDKSPFFMLTWTVMHKMDETSPFFGFTVADFKRENVNLFISLIGYDETFSETVHSGWRYDVNQIHFGKQFVDVIELQKDGTRILNFHRFHDVIA